MAKSPVTMKLDEAVVQDFKALAATLRMEQNELLRRLLVLRQIVPLTYRLKAGLEEL